MADRVEMESFTSYLLNVTGCKTLTELSLRLGVTRATLNNWNKSSVAKLSPSTQKKLRDAFEKNPEWGIRLGVINNSTIEIINSGRDTKDSNQASSNSDSDILLKQVLKENFQLKSEMTILKEKLSKYEARK